MTNQKQCMFDTKQLVLEELLWDLKELLRYNKTADARRFVEEHPEVVVAFKSEFYIN